MAKHYSIVYTDLDGTPAMVHRPSGTIYIDKTMWAQLPDNIRDIILLHEKGHVELDTKNEIEADSFAFRNFAGTRRQSLKSLVDAAYHHLDMQNPAHQKRFLNTVMTALKYDYEKYGNSRALNLYKNLKNMQDLAQTLNAELLGQGISIPFDEVEQIAEYLTAVKQVYETDSFNAGNFQNTVKRTLKPLPAKLIPNIGRIEATASKHTKVPVANIRMAVGQTNPKPVKSPEQLAKEKKAAWEKAWANNHIKLFAEFKTLNTTSKLGLSTPELKSVADYFIELGKIFDLEKNIYDWESNIVTTNTPARSPARPTSTRPTFRRYTGDDPQRAEEFLQMLNEFEYHLELEANGYSYFSLKGFFQKAGGAIKKASGAIKKLTDGAKRVIGNVAGGVLGIPPEITNKAIDISNKITGSLNPINLIGRNTGTPDNVMPPLDGLQHDQRPATQYQPRPATTQYQPQMPFSNSISTGANNFATKAKSFFQTNKMAVIAGLVIVAAAVGFFVWKKKNQY